jgi:hypothetical protein
MTLDDKRIGYNSYMSPLYIFRNKLDSSIFYFGEDTNTVKHNKIYNLFYEDPAQTTIIVKEFKKELYSKTKFRLLSTEESRILKMKSIGFDFVN